MDLQFYIYIIIFYIFIMLKQMEKIQSNRSANQLATSDDESENVLQSNLPIRRKRESMKNCLRKLRCLGYIILIFAVIGLAAFFIQKKYAQQEQKIMKMQLEIQQLKLNEIKLSKQVQDEIKISASAQQKMKMIESQIAQVVKASIKEEKQEINAPLFNQQKLNNSSYKFDISKLSNPNKVIQITYLPGQLSKLPLDTLKTNTEGKKIEEVLYPDAEMRKKRIQFQQQRKQFIQSRSYVQQISLIEFNNPLNEETQKRGKEANEKQWLRLQKKYSLSKITTELPFCLIVPGYNNNARFRIEHNLNSIFKQNYTNYKVVVIDDASTDGSPQIYKKYFQFYKIDKKLYTFIQNKWKSTSLPNHFFGTLLHCEKDSIAIHIDADDELIGRNVLQVFNWAYQTMKAGVIYSNYYAYNQPSVLYPGPTKQYTDEQKKNTLFRTIFPIKFSMERSYRVQLLYQVDPKEFLDFNGNFYLINYDFALLVPLMEVACGRVRKIQEQFHYLYNVGTGNNDYTLHVKGQFQILQQISKKKKKNECWKQFDERMKK